MSSNRLVELRDSLEALRAEVAELADKDVLTEDEEARFDGAVAEFEAAQAELAKAEERAAKVEQIRTAPVREPAQAPTVIVRSHKDIFDLSEIRTLEPRAAKAELRARALDAIEGAPEHMSHDARETATRHAEKNPAIAEHILRTGSPAYHEAFEDYILGAPVNATAAEARAAMSLTGANGGYLVPFSLDPTVLASNAGSSNPFRQISRVVTITTDDWNGVTSAGVTAEWLAENTEAADASPTFTQPSITAHKAAAYLEASVEITQDSGIASEIAGLIADAKDRLEATAFATGSGSGQPKGIATVISLTTTSRVAGSSGAAGAADLVAADIYALDASLSPRFRPGASFVGERTVLNKVRQLGTADSYHAFWVDFGGGMPASLIGYPVFEASAMDSTIVSGSNDEVLILGDFRQGYVIVDRVGLSVAYNPMVIGSNRRPTGAVGWFATWRVGGDAVLPGAFRGLRL